jgi:Protein of unknown function (DUF3551)
MMMKIIMRLMFAAAALPAALCFDVPASHASFGGAPWCLVKTGGDDAYLDCEYRTSQECLQALAAGNRGFCNVNPSPSPSAPSAVAQPGRRKWRSQQR